MTRLVIRIKDRPASVVKEPPSGLFNTISFGRLVNQLRKAGEIKEHETITHLDIDVDRGCIAYRIDDR